MIGTNNMSLDEVIARNKRNSIFNKELRGDKEYRGGKPRIHSGGARGFHSSTIPEGRWTHDKFGDLEGENNLAALRLGANGNKTVRVLLSNLAPSVSTSDLEELFEPYNCDAVSVHYNENGKSLGSGDAHLKRKDAEKMMSDFSGMAIDKFVVTMGIVATTSNISQRVEIPAKFHRVITPGGIRKKRFASRSGSIGRGLIGRRDEHDDRVPRKTDRGGAGRRYRDRKPKMSEEELNRQLDAYMSKNSKIGNNGNVHIS